MKKDRFTPLSLRIRKDMKVRERKIGEELKGVLKGLVIFARKADHDIRAD